MSPRHTGWRAGTHTDGFAAIFPDRLRPMLPCARTGFTALTERVEKGIAPPAEGDVAPPASGDLVNMCTLGHESAPAVDNPPAEEQSAGWGGEEADHRGSTRNPAPPGGTG